MVAAEAELLDAVQCHAKDDIIFFKSIFSTSGVLDNTFPCHRQSTKQIL